MAAGKELTPSDVKNTRRLMEYWAHGEGRLKWIGSPTPYTTLVQLLSKYVHDPAELHGLAANIFHEATGIYPGQRPKALGGHGGKR